MSRKTKFRLEIRRVRLNPEQAVLSCDCYSGPSYATMEETTGNSFVSDSSGPLCSGPGKEMGTLIADPTGRDILYSFIASS